MNKELCRQCYYKNEKEEFERRDWDDQEQELIFEDLWARGMVKCKCYHRDVFLENLSIPSECPFKLEHLVSKDEPTEKKILSYSENPIYYHKLIQYKKDNYF